MRTEVYLLISVERNCACDVFSMLLTAGACLAFHNIALGFSLTRFLYVPTFRIEETNRPW